MSAAMPEFNPQDEGGLTLQYATVSSSLPLRTVGAGGVASKWHVPFKGLILRQELS